ncbi:MAG: hypothetical protein NTW87_31520 [Planctomycetota bacterium]|nr:hypothetical protein [Planctomycetota bacterium]
MHILLAYAWTLCVLVSFIGWGFAVNRLLYRQSDVHWGLQATWGIALTTAVGGLLNFGGLVSVRIVLLYVFVGVAFFVRGKMRGARPDSAMVARLKALFAPDRWTAALWLLLLPCLAADVAVWTWYADPNFADDLQSYFVFAERMLQAGSSGPDPFSGILHLSSLGGQSFLATLLLSVVSFRYLNLLDAGLGLVITLGLIHHARGRAGVPARQAILLMLFVTLAPLPHVNVSALRLGAAMLLSLVLTMELLCDSASDRLRHSVLLALVFSCLCCLKTTFVPVTVCAFLGFHCLRLSQRGEWRNALREIAGVAALSTLLLLPWMIAMYRSGGTLLFPLLGRGNHGSVFNPSFWSPFGDGDLAQTLLASQSDYLLVILEVAGLAWLLSRPWRTPQNWPALALLPATVVASLALASAASRVAAVRFSFPMDIAALSMLVCFAFRKSEGGTGIPGGRAHPVLGVALLLLVAAASGFSRPWPPKPWQRLSKALPQLASSAEEDARDVKRWRFTAGAQESVPPGARILVRAAWPSLMDFSRNPVYVADRPGMFSPPPGMPLGEGPEALAEYLTANGVSYVIYSYRDEANHGPEVTTPRILRPEHMVQRPEALATVAFHKDLKGLPRCRKKIHDDGYFMVVDLGQPLRK